MPCPILFGRRMRTIISARGVTVWASRYGGITASVGHGDERHNKRPWFWQLDAWGKTGVLDGSERTERAALSKLERALGTMLRGMPTAALEVALTGGL